MPLHILLLLPWLSTLAGYLQFHLPHCRPSHMLTCHAWALCTFFSARSVFFCCCFNKLPLCASFIESAARCCCCRWMPQLQLRLTCIQCGLKAANFNSVGGGGGFRPREIGMLQHLCQCQHCQDVRACHFARCIAWCLFFLAFLRLLNGVEIAGSFKKNCMQCARQFAGMPGLSNGCSSWSIWAHIKRNKRVLYFVAYFWAYWGILPFAYFYLCFRDVIKNPCSNCKSKCKFMTYFTAFAGNFLLMTCSHISLHVSSLLSLLMPCGKAGCGCADFPSLFLSLFLLPHLDCACPGRKDISKIRNKLVLLLYCCLSLSVCLYLCLSVCVSFIVLFMCRISCCMIFLFLLPLPISCSLSQSLALLLFVKLYSEKSLKAWATETLVCTLAVHVCICVRVCLLFWVFLLGFVFGFILVAQFRLLAALFEGLEATTKDILIKMLTVSLSLPLSLSLSPFLSHSPFIYFSPL